MHIMYSVAWRGGGRRAERDRLKEKKMRRAIEAEVGCDGGGYYVMWTRGEKIVAWYGPRDECIARAAGPAPKKGWYRPEYTGGHGDAATATGMYDAW